MTPRFLSFLRSSISRRASSFSPPGWLGVSTRWPRNWRLDGLNADFAAVDGPARSSSFPPPPPSSSSSIMDVRFLAADSFAWFAARFSRASRSRPSSEPPPGGLGAGAAKTCFSLFASSVPSAVAGLPSSEDIWERRLEVLPSLLSLGPSKLGSAARSDDEQSDLRF